MAEFRFDSAVVWLALLQRQKPVVYPESSKLPTVRSPLAMKNASKLSGLSSCSAASLCGLWCVLVALAVVGRLWQPGWNITPMAGTALAAGVLFANPLVAASVPLAALAVSNLALPGYGSVLMAVVVYAATLWPVLLGSTVRSGRLRETIGSALACSLVFYLSTNLAHWWLTTDYPHTLTGLLTCYASALPFYRWMPVGDVAWSLALVGGLWAVGGIVQSASQRTGSTPFACGSESGSECR
jgi:hypothetical protein